jgi:hypothetical protein
MIAVVTILLAFPLGFFLRSHLAANVAYAIAYLWAFVFQGIYLMLDYVEGGRSTFGKDEFPLSYGLVAGAIFAVGFGLVAVGHRLGSRRRSRDMARG